MLFDAFRCFFFFFWGIAVSRPFVFVHEGFASHRGAYLIEKGDLRLISRGIYAPPDASDDELLGDALRALAYRYDGVRLMGESARRVLEDGLSPVILPQKQVFAAGGGVACRRERELFPGSSVILRPEWQDSPAESAGGSPAGGSPFLSLSKRLVVDLGHGGTAFWDAPCAAQILWDAAFCPECAPPPETCMRLLQGVPEAHLNRLLEQPEMQKAATVLGSICKSCSRYKHARPTERFRLSARFARRPAGT